MVQTVKGTVDAVRTGGVCSSSGSDPITETQSWRGSVNGGSRPNLLTTILVASAIVAAALIVTHNW